MTQPEKTQFIAEIHEFYWTLILLNYLKLLTNFSRMFYDTFIGVFNKIRHKILLV